MCVLIDRRIGSVIVGHVGDCDFDRGGVHVGLAC